MTESKHFWGIIMVTFADIERIKSECGLSTEGVCSMLGISKTTYYGWKNNGISPHSKLQPLLRLFTKDPLQLIKQHSEDFKED